MLETQKQIISFSKRKERMKFKDFKEFIKRIRIWPLKFDTKGLQFVRIIESKLKIIRPQITMAFE